MMQHDTTSREVRIPHYLHWLARVCLAIGGSFALLAPAVRAQVNDQAAPASAAEVKQLRDEVQSLLKRVDALEQQLNRQQPAFHQNMESSPTLVNASYPPNLAEKPGSSATPQPAVDVAAASPVTVGPTQAAAAPQEHLVPGDRAILDYLRGTTVNFLVDEYYEYNFNDPVGRVNALRAYDVLSNNISLNQADVVFEHAPDVDAGKRFGVRLDLQFGQATDTLQGNPTNEPRPEIYRNIFQAYGTYVAPIGNGLTIDVGKFGSSIGIEGNYTKDQMNYSRSYWFDFLPFYHMGVRTAYKVNDKLALNYWVVNGTNQAEATNGYKDELFGFTATPNKNITWNVNYYLGQEHPDRVEVASSGPIPVQPGLTFQAINPPPNGKLHIFDTYVTWQATPKVSFALEGDYVVEREWKNTDTSLGESSAPEHAIGGAAYAKYQFSSRFAIAGRAEYLSDRGGLFSGLTQALKETTATFDFKVYDGLLMRYEWRWDFSNQPSFFTDRNNILSKEQQTATVGVVWWVGRKEGAW